MKKRRLSVLWRKHRKYFKKILKFFWEVLYYGIIGLIGLSCVYDGYQTPQVPFWLTISVLFILIFNNKALKSSYKDWSNRADYDESYKKFIEKYRMPLLLPQIFFALVFARYCSIGSFLILSILLIHSDTLERRWLTTNIKQDIILNRLRSKD